MRLFPKTKTLVAVCLASTALVAPAVAQAQSITGLGSPLDVLPGGTVVDFDTIAAGQYNSATFGDLTIVSTGGFTINSNFSGSYNTSGQSINNNSGGSNDFRFNFSSEVSGLAFNFGASDVIWTLVAFDAANNALGSTTIDPTQGSNAGEYFGVNANSISYATLTAQGGGDWVFVDNLTFLLFGSGVQEMAQLTAAATTTGRIVTLNAGGLTRSRGQDSLTTRDEVLSFTRVADPETGSFTVTQSTMDSAQMMGGLYTWVDLTGFRAEDDGTNRSYTGRGLQIGADMEVMPDMVVGLSLGVQDLDATVGAVGQDGVLRYLQPYMAYAAGAWSGEASLIYGWGDFTQTSGGGTGEGDTRLAALTFNGGYDIALDQGVTVTPMLGLVHGVERVEGVSGTLAGAGTETVRFTQASLGGEVSQSTASGEIFAGLHAEWLNTDADTALVSDLLVDDGWTGRLEIGLSTEVGNGISLDTSVALSGLGGDLRSTSGALRFAFRF